jgi:hypothetical protein
MSIPVLNQVVGILKGLASFFYTLEGGPNWYLLLVIISLSAFVAGFYYVNYLRQCCKSSKQATSLIRAVFAIPIGVFLACNILSFLNILEKMIADAVSFGIVTGILMRLTLPPKERENVKLVVQQVNGKNCEVWLDSPDSTVLEVRAKIAQQLEVTPGRVAIESGKGSFIDNLNQPFAPLIDDAFKTIDFFGFMTISCYVFVKDEEPVKKRVSIVEDSAMEQQKRSFLNILQKQIKYGDQVHFTAKIAAACEARSFFTIACVDKFAAAAPSTLQQLIAVSSVRLHSWKDLTEGTVDGGSEAGDSITNSTPPKPKRASPLVRFRKGKKEEYFGQPIRHGDTLLLEWNGKFLSVARGWWMQWTSSEPRRSGAFTLEIIEKAPQNRLKEQFDVLKERIGVSPTHTNPRELDNVLRPGDSFRLVSVKFPQYELGITSVKLRGEYCYLGLRKIGSDHDGGDGEWCMEVRFIFREKML